MALVFTSYGATNGVATPPVADVARQARTTLLLCSPQGSTLMRSAAVMPSEVAEITYSLMDGCDRYSFDADVELFRRIAKGQLPESAFYDQMIMLQKLNVALSRSAIAEREEVREAAGLAAVSQRRPSTVTFGGSTVIADEDDLASARPTVSSVLRTLRKFFPSKTADEFRLLQRALLLDVKAISLNGDEPSPRGQPSITRGGNGPQQKGALAGMGVVSPAHLALDVDVQQLFASNEGGNQGYFLEAVRNQHLESLSTYMAEVQCAILALGAPDTSATTSPRNNGLRSMADARAKRSSTTLQKAHANQQQVSVISIRDRLAEIDPVKPRSDINLYVYHLLQLLYTDRHRLNAPDSDLIHKLCEDWFEPPLCYHNVNVEEIAKYCPQVLAKRCGPAGALSPNVGLM